MEKQSQTTSRVSEKLSTATLTICLAASLLGLLELLPKNLINPTNLLEFLFFALVLINFNNTDLKRFLISLLTTISITSIILIARNFNTPLFESVRAYKWAFFLIGLIISLRKNRLSPRVSETCFRLLLATMFITYALQVAINGLDSRPYLMIENNYECALLIGFFIIQLNQQKLISKTRYLIEHSLVISIILMSQSRSSLLSLIAVLMINIKFSRRTSNKIVLGIILLASSTIAILFTLNNRGTSIVNLDRYRFLTLFAEEFRSRSIIEQLFGSWIIQPLNYETCIKLKFYSSLQNDESLGSCYSVVLHSFLLRAVNDFGIIGSIGIFSTFSFILFDTLKKNIALSLLVLAIVNSASVSGINNVYIILPVLIALLSEETQRKASPKTPKLEKFR